MGRRPSRDTSPAGSANSTVSATRRSGPNSVDRAGLGVPVSRATTSRSTPVSCSAISCAEPNRPAGSGSVARTSSRWNDSYRRKTGMCRGSGSESANTLVYPWKSNVSTASVRATVYRSDATDGPDSATSGAW
ncbi:hypothetical protein ATE80_29460 [Streptomyces kanasensis]|uniref:Uncharacterized protein n=1 Tax=Streptomyces kanasensis TaxID=936756 RepID=A0A124EBS5_9ACTN|nr:hypothetical protein ATE80_29460 [Streptomyces kanasensis]